PHAREGLLPRPPQSDAVLRVGKGAGPTSRARRQVSEGSKLLLRLGRDCLGLMLAPREGIVLCNRLELGEKGSGRGGDRGAAMDFIVSFSGIPLQVVALGARGANHLVRLGADGAQLRPAVGEPRL